MLTAPTQKGFKKVKVSYLTCWSQQSENVNFVAPRAQTKYYYQSSHDRTEWKCCSMRGYLYLLDKPNILQNRRIVKIDNKN